MIIYHSIIIQIWAFKSKIIYEEFITKVPVAILIYEYEMHYIHNDKNISTFPVRDMPAFLDVM